MWVIHLLVTWCTQGCSVWTIIVIIGKWAPGRAGYRVIINSIYSLLSPDSQLHTEPRPRLTSHNWNRSKKSGYNHNNWLRWDELYRNSEIRKRKGGGGWVSVCLIIFPVWWPAVRPGHCRQGPFIVSSQTPGGPGQTKEANIVTTTRGSLLRSRSQPADLSG